MFSRVLKEIEAFKKLNSLIRSLLKRKDSLNSETVSARFVRLFESHGVHRNQIPRFFGHDLLVADIKDDDALLPKLTDDMLDDVCELFAVKREWLDCAQSTVYEVHDFYRHVDEFSNLLDRLEANNPDGSIDGRLYAPLEKCNDAGALIVLDETIGFVGDKSISRYHLCGNWRFDYWKSRVYLAACVGIAWKRNIYIDGVKLSMGAISQYEFGEKLLGECGEGLVVMRGERWHPEDMLDTPDVFLHGIEPEDNNHGVKCGLERWLELCSQGYMDAGNDVAKAKSSFELALSRVN